MIAGIGLTGDGPMTGTGRAVLVGWRQLVTVIDPGMIEPSMGQAVRGLRQQGENRRRNQDNESRRDGVAQRSHDATRYSNTLDLAPGVATS